MTPTQIDAITVFWEINHRRYDSGGRRTLRFEDILSYGAQHSIRSPERLEELWEVIRRVDIAYLEIEAANDEARIKGLRAERSG